MHADIINNLSNPLILVLELSVDERIYVLKFEVDDQLHGYDKGNKFDNPVGLYETVLEPCEEFLADTEMQHERYSDQ